MRAKSADLGPSVLIKKSNCNLLFGLLLGLRSYLSDHSRCPLMHGPSGNVISRSADESISLRSSVFR